MTVGAHDTARAEGTEGAERSAPPEEAERDEGAEDAEQVLGLRERKKQATREALSRAALQLALEHGPENVRVDDIAAAAGVSPRTYNNYFASRAEAICGIAHDQASRIGAALRARPAEESLADAIKHVIMEAYAGQGEPDRAVIGMISSSRELRGEYFKAIMAIEGSLSSAIAARTGMDAVRDLYPRALAAVVTSVIRVATVHWLRHDTAPYAAVLRETLEHIAPMAHSP
jgi:AcrR family transcriptional regulator